MLLLALQYLFVTLNVESKQV